MTDDFDGVMDVGDPSRPRYIKPSAEEEPENPEPAPQQVESQEEEPKDPQEPVKEPEKKEQVKQSETKEEPVQEENFGETKSVEGETPKERALRAKLQEQARQMREMMGKGLFGDPKPVTQKRQLPEDKKERLKKYDPKEVETFREIFGIIAEEEGYVKSGDVEARSRQSEDQAVLDQFLEVHPEYTKDTDLWNALRSEVGLYRQPVNSKELKRILEKAHDSVYGIKPASDLKKVEAKQEKVKAASHSGQNPKGGSVREKAIDPNLRAHMIGFTDEELDDMFGEQ